MLTLMAEVCVSTDMNEGGEICSAGEVLILALVIEICFWIFIFVGGWSLLNRLRIRRVRLKRQKAEAEKWNPSRWKE